MPNKRRFSNAITSTPCHLPLMTTVISLTLHHIAHIPLAILSEFLTFCLMLNEINTNDTTRTVLATQFSSSLGYLTIA